MFQRTAVSKCCCFSLQQPVFACSLEIRAANRRGSSRGRNAVRSVCPRNKLILKQDDDHHH